MLKLFKYFLGAEPADVDQPRRVNIRLTQQEFEEWADDMGYDISRDFDDSYLSHITDLLFEGWVAAYLLVQHKIDQGDC